MSLIQKCIFKTSLLTKGPMALFYGGQEIIPFLSTDSAKSAFMSHLILIILSPMLQLIIQLYKKVKFRKEIKYEQQLQQAVMSGVRNVYKPIIIFVGFLGFCVCGLIHLYVSEQNTLCDSSMFQENNGFYSRVRLTKC